MAHIRQSRPYIFWHWLSGKSLKLAIQVLLFPSLFFSSLELRVIYTVYEPQVRARFGTASHFWEVVVLKFQVLLPRVLVSAPWEDERDGEGERERGGEGERGRGREGERERRGEGERERGIWGERERGGEGEMAHKHTASNRTGTYLRKTLSREYGCLICAKFVP